MITDKINFKQPKYMLPAILYPLLLITGYLVFDIFDTETAEKPSELQTTEFLNPELPQPQIRNDGIAGKYESMVKSYGKIQDYSAVENIDMDNQEEDKEGYDSKYSKDDLALLDMEAAQRTEELEKLQRSQEMQEKLRQKLEAKTGKHVELTVKVEPDLIGGVKLTMGGVQYDGTVRHHLDELQRILQTNSN